VTFSPPSSRWRWPSVKRSVASLAPVPTKIAPQFLQSLREDLELAVFTLWVNRLAASCLVPRVLRFVMLRVAGVETLTANIVDGVVFRNSRVTIGPHTFINTRVYVEGPVAIGGHCHIGPGVMLCASTHGFVDGVASRSVRVLPITIGDNCWVGMGALILPGVTIGEDSIIAAGAVVAEDCDGGGTYGGVPARRIR
jgi:acetyltransferase-like isoleucine patch superfamily enzyme